MPYYDYECCECGHVFEKFHGITENDKYTCPKCKKKTKKLIGGKIGAKFVGPGFYENDYKEIS